jgi:thiol-disulfide isomerase/thioredoxin
MKMKSLTRIQVMAGAWVLFTCSIEAFSPMILVASLGSGRAPVSRNTAVLRMDAGQGEAGATSLLRSVPLLASRDELQELISNAGGAGHGVMVLFKKEICRKCAALAPKYERLSRNYADRNIVWVMVNADKLTKAHRAEYNLKSVPALQYFSTTGECLIEYQALGGISEILVDVAAMAEKYGEVLEPGRTVLSAVDLDLKLNELAAAPAPATLSGRLMRADSRAGVMKAVFWKVGVEGA